MRRLLLVIFLLLTCIKLSAQDELVLSYGKKTFNIPTHTRQGTLYFSIKHFSDALGIKSSYNPDTEKSELKFEDYNLRVTAQNPYIVLSPVSNKKPVLKAKTYQLPTSSYVINGLTYIPVEYSLEALMDASGAQIEFKKPNRLIVTGEITGPVKEKMDGQPSAKKVFNISGLAIEEKANGTLIRVKSNKKIKTYKSEYKKGILSIILRDVLADAASINKNIKKGLVKEVRVKNENNDSVLEFVLTQEYTTSEVIDIAGSNDILITIHNKIFARDENNDKNKDKWNFDVIVIDAGHGGKDHGAIGVNGVKEKDVNLGIALKLGKIIEKNMKDVKVIYTRSNDTFIELYKRGKIANENGGKLFISVHCNSTPKKPSDATGFEVYLLRPGRTKEAISIAERENSVIKYEENPGRYQNLTDENFILVSMAHSSYMKYSEKYAELLNRQFDGDLSLESRGVKQAGFYVLVGASMPSVLIETGFLSNKKDADYLGSSKGQQTFAESIYQSVKKFKDYYDKLMDSE